MMCSCYPVSHRLQSHHAEGGFHFPDISFKYNSVHPKRSARLDILLQIIDKKTFLRFQRKRTDNGKSEGQALPSSAGLKIRSR